MNFDISWMEQFVTAFNPSSSAAQATVTSLLPVGTSLFYSVAALCLSFSSLKMMLSDDGALGQISLLINSLIQIGLVYYPLQQYQEVLQFINQGFEQVVGTIAGDTAGNQAFAGFRQLLSMGLTVYRSIPSQIGMSWTDLWNLKEAAALLEVRWFDTAVTGFALLGMAIAAVLYVAIYSYSLVMFMVGAIVGPIMLPWYLLSPFRYIAEGWIKFMINAGMQRVVAIALISIMTPFISQMNSTIQQQATSITNTADKLSVATNHMLFSFGALLLSLLIIYILTKIPEMTSGLLSGGSGGGLNIAGAAKSISTGKAPATAAPTSPRTNK